MSRAPTPGPAPSPAPGPSAPDRRRSQPREDEPLPAPHGQAPRGPAIVKRTDVIAIGAFVLALAARAMSGGHLEAYWLMAPAVLWGRRQGGLRQGMVLLCVSVALALVADEWMSPAARPAWDRFLADTLLYTISCLLGFWILAHEALETRARRLKLLETGRQQESMLNSLMVGMVKTRHQQIIWQNKAAAQILGYETADILSKPGRMLYFDDASYADMRRQARMAIAEGREFKSQLKLRRKSGDPVWLDVSASRTAEDTNDYLWLMLDITEKKQYQDQIEHIAFYDALTGLPNRLLLADRLHQGFMNARRQQKNLALGYIDLDGFKEVNDLHGHHAGDVVLTEMALRLQAALRSSDTVSRLGGDEFALILAPIEDRDHCRLVLTRMLGSVTRLIELGAGQSVHISLSIGVALFPKDASNARVLLEMADQAMYQSKHRGGNQITFFSPDLVGDEGPGS